MGMSYLRESSHTRALCLFTADVVAARIIMLRFLFTIALILFVPVETDYRKIDFITERIIYPKRTSPRVTNSSSTASSSSSSSSSERPKPSKIAAPHPVIDSHRAEAIDDCIEFINSSSSLPRSNSTTQ
ncbi:hypothetical protein M9H77_05978 [Catharanthus roseus]|uniref:Uncharacterized protein n=1 Tax=Catharanthus roseus TaxID=4058 RepID=A0ACC0BR62_CATRO|nr:hypothetical protein M9H77_05978 [Catharanthus roseus]